MKFKLLNLILCTIFMTLSLGRAHGAGTKPEILSDGEMAAIEGGFCLFKKCPTGPPAGKCQPLPPTLNGVCQYGTCRYVFEPTGLGPFQICTKVGQGTCTKSDNYRACITGNITTICWPSSINVCGDAVDPFCTEDLSDKVCSCGIHVTTQPCDWTNCLLEGE